MENQTSVQSDTGTCTHTRRILKSHLREELKRLLVQREGLLKLALIVQITCQVHLGPRLRLLVLLPPLRLRQHAPHRHDAVAALLVVCAQAPSAGIDGLFKERRRRVCFPAPARGLPVLPHGLCELLALLLGHLDDASKDSAKVLVVVELACFDFSGLDHGLQRGAHARNLRGQALEQLLSLGPVPHVPLQTRSQLREKVLARHLSLLDRLGALVHRQLHLQDRQLLPIVLLQARLNHQLEVGEGLVAELLFAKKLGEPRDVGSDGGLAHQDFKPATHVTRTRGQCGGRRKRTSVLCAAHWQFFSNHSTLEQQLTSASQRRATDGCKKGKGQSAFVCCTHRVGRSLSLSMPE